MEKTRNYRLARSLIKLYASLISLRCAWLFILFFTRFRSPSLRAVAPSHVSITGPSEARENELVPLQCSTAPSNPPAEIKWMVNGRRIQNTTSRTVVSPEGMCLHIYLYVLGACAQSPAVCILVYMSNCAATRVEEWISGGFRPHTTELLC